MVGLDGSSWTTELQNGWVGRELTDRRAKEWLGWCRV